MDQRQAANSLFNGHWFDMAATQRDLMRFLGMFVGCNFVMAQMANEGRAYTRKGRPFHPLEELFDDHFVAEVSRVLIQTAATIRLLDDMAGPAVVSVSFPVGYLLEAKASSIPLTIREACNKIIHANFVKFDLGEITAGESHMT